MGQLTQCALSIQARIGDATVIIFVSDTTDVDAAGRAAVAMPKRESKRRWNHHQGEVEDKDSRELHSRTTKNIKQADERSECGRNLSRRWVSK